MVDEILKPTRNRGRFVPGSKEHLNLPRDPKTGKFLPKSALGQLSEKLQLSKSETDSLKPFSHDLPDQHALVHPDVLTRVLKEHDKNFTSNIINLWHKEHPNDMISAGKNFNILEGEQKKLITSSEELSNLFGLELEQTNISSEALKEILPFIKETEKNTRITNETLDKIADNIERDKVLDHIPKKGLIESARAHAVSRRHKTVTDKKERAKREKEEGSIGLIEGLIGYKIGKDLLLPAVRPLVSALGRGLITFAPQIGLAVGAAALGYFISKGLMDSKKVRERETQRGETIKKQRQGAFQGSTSREIEDIFANEPNTLAQYNKLIKPEEKEKFLLSYGVEQKRAHELSLQQKPLDIKPTLPNLQSPTKLQLQESPGTTDRYAPPGAQTSEGISGGKSVPNINSTATPISSGPPVPVSRDLAKNQQEAYDAARANGLSDSAAKILVANMSGESLANPSDNHWDVHHMSQGIVQWDPQRSAAIAKQFGKEPKDMSVTEQTKAAIWEMKTHPEYRQSWEALNNEQLTPQERLHAVVANYERPSNVSASTNDRLNKLSQLQIMNSNSSNSNSNNDAIAASLQGPAVSQTGQAIVSATEEKERLQASSSLSPVHPIISAPTTIHTQGSNEQEKTAAVAAVRNDDPTILKAMMADQNFA